MQNKLTDTITISLSDEDAKLLNTKLGMRQLFAQKNINLEKAIRDTKYENRLLELQAELIKLQTWVIKNNKKLVVIFEGRDSAGKGGAIRRIIQHLNPRHYRIVALPKPDEVEAGQWYFQRYVNQLPIAGEIVFFDRSWYNRAVVEPVNDFCTDEEYKVFMGQVNEFEKMVVESNIQLIKFYFSITKEEQAKRFEDVKNSPLKQWKMSAVDAKAQELWDVYTKYKEAMFAKTDTKLNPWIVIEANKKTAARVEAIEHILKKVPYKS